MDVSVRTAREADAAAIASLTLQLGYDLTPAAAASRLSRLLLRRDHLVVVAEHGGRVVGWMHIAVSEHVESESVAVIHGLVADKDHRRKGIGHLLIARAEQWTRDQGCSVVRLTSSGARTEAHQFYERVGFARLRTQYAFAKSVGDEADGNLRRFVPRVDL